LLLFFRKEESSLLLQKDRRMNIFRICGLALLALISACALPASGQPENPLAYKVVLIAGDDSIRVFDNAVSGLRARLLLRQGFTPAAITRLTAFPHHAGAPQATLTNVVDTIADMHPAPGQACLVYATSHGVRDGGLYLSASDGPLSPLALNLALNAGCGDAPTIVIISACFSGQFAQPPMTSPNRIILTAARLDRTSFGCQAGRIYTVYDQCFLSAFDAAADWHEVYDLTKTCVAGEEDREHVLASEPQAWFGPYVTNLPLPLRRP
jgi:hypothetical protein